MVVRLIPPSDLAASVARKKPPESRKASSPVNVAGDVTTDAAARRDAVEANTGAETVIATNAVLPSALFMRLASVMVLVHLAVIAIAYLAVVRSSGIQGRVVDGFAPYLATFHLAPEGNSADAVSAEGVAFYLARGDGAERVYRLEIASGEKPDDSQWRPATWVAEGGSERARRYQRYLAAIAELGSNDQNALAGRLILPAMQRDTDADWVRIVRLPNLMTNVVQDAEPAPYTAAILRDGGSIRLVRVAQPRLTSAATP